jgi:hypothetical protein
MCCDPADFLLWTSLKTALRALWRKPVIIRFLRLNCYVFAHLKAGIKPLSANYGYTFARACKERAGDT